MHKKQDDNLDKITVLRFCKNEYIINTSGINKIEDVFEIYKEKQAN